VTWKRRVQGLESSGKDRQTGECTYGQEPYGYNGSNVCDTVYDYSTVALGPLACNMNLGAQGTVKPKVDHVGRCLPTR
jgi:hypothetical protein